MNVDRAKMMAEDLMRHHGLSGWTFQFDGAKRRFGCCHYTLKVISLSTHLVTLNTEDRVLDAITHEVAHAILGVSAGHSSRWKELHKALGGSGRTLYSVSDTVIGIKPWAAKCPNCPLNRWTAHRRRKLICRNCKAKIVYSRTGGNIS